MDTLVREWTLYAAAKSWFLNLADSPRQVFLARLSHDLTIHGRSFGLHLAGEEQVRAFKGLNELRALTNWIAL